MGVVYLEDFRVYVFISDWWYRAVLSEGGVAKVLRRLRWDCFEGRGWMYAVVYKRSGKLSLFEMRETIVTEVLLWIVYDFNCDCVFPFDTLKCIYTITP
jgi:hypothetical protein